MATPASLGRRRFLATQRIDSAANQIAERLGIDWIGPEKTKDSEVMVARTLEAWAGNLERIAEVLPVAPTPISAATDKPSATTTETKGAKAA